MNQQPNIPNGQQNGAPSPNWRDDMTVQDRAHFVAQLAQALKHLSPNTTEQDIFAAAKNFESTLYQRSTNKNQYILAYARKFNQIKYQIQMQTQNGVAPSAGGAGAGGPGNTGVVNDQLNGLGASPLMNTQQPQSSVSPQMQAMQQQMQNMPNALNPNQQVPMQVQNQMRTNMFQQASGLQQQQSNLNHQLQQQNQNQNQQNQSQIQPQQNQNQNQNQQNTQQQNQVPSEMLAFQQRAAAMGNPTSLPMGAQQQQSSPASAALLQNLQNGQSPMALSQQQQQVQVFLARQMALQQQQQQQQQQNQQGQQGQAGQQQQNNQNPQHPQHQQPGLPPNMDANAMMNMAMANRNMNRSPAPNSASGMPVSGAQANYANMNMMNQMSMMQNSLQNQSQHISPELMLQMQQQQKHQLQQQHLQQGQQGQQGQPGQQGQQGQPSQPGQQGQQNPQHQQIQQQQLQQMQQLQQLRQRQSSPAQPQQAHTQAQHQPNNFSQQQTDMNNAQQPNDSTPQLQQNPRNTTAQQRSQATEMIRQLDETISSTRARARPLENLTDQEKNAIRENVLQMRTMYEKIDQLLPIFLALTSNIEATRRLILMKYMFEDQLNVLSQNIYLVSLENLQKLRDQFSGYFSWVRNAISGNSTQASLQQTQQQQNQIHQQQQHQLQLQQQQHLQQQNAAQISSGQPNNQAMDQLQQTGSLPYNGMQQQVQPPSTQAKQQQPHHPPQQVNRPTPAGSQAEPSNNIPPGMQYSPNPNLIKRESIDLKLPVSKKQRIANQSSPSVPASGQQQQQTPQQPHQQSQQQQRPSPVAVPSVASPSAPPVSNAPQMVDLTRSASLTASPGPAKSEPPMPNPMAGPTPMASVLGQSQQIQLQQANMSPMQKEAQQQMIYQSAINSGIPRPIADILPHRALQCCWLLHQANQNRVHLNEKQHEQIQGMLAESIALAKEQLAGKQGHQQQPQQSSPTSLPTQQQQIGQQQLAQQQQQQDQLNQKQTHGQPQAPQQHVQQDTLPSNADVPIKTEQKSNMIDLTTAPTTTTTTTTNAPVPQNTAAMPRISMEKAMELAASSTTTSPSQQATHIMQLLQHQQKMDGASPTAVPASSSIGTTSAPSVAAPSTVPPTAGTMAPNVAPSTVTAAPTPNLRPGMGQDGKVMNPITYANDVLKDVASLLATPSSSADSNSTPLFMVDDYITDNSTKGDNKDILGSDRRTVLFSESPLMVHNALKEGFKDETFGTNELDTKYMLQSSTNNSSYPWPDQSSNSSSLSSSSFSSCDLNEEFVKNNWYQVGMDKDVLSIAETMPGLEFDEDGYLNCGGTSRLSHPPLF